MKARCSLRLGCLSKKQLLLVGFSIKYSNMTNNLDDFGVPRFYETTCCHAFRTRPDGSSATLGIELHRCCRDQEGHGQLPNLQRQTSRQVGSNTKKD
jgi:hypothetical protein